MPTDCAALRGSRRFFLRNARAACLSIDLVGFDVQWAIPNYRLRPTDKTVMTFSERKVGEPQAIRAWFYPGDNSGQEFVYPKARAVEMAKVTNQPVLFMPTELAPFLIEPVKTATEPPVGALREAPVRAVTPTGQEVALTEVVSPPPVQTASVQQTGGTSQTAGAPQTTDYNLTEFVRVKFKRVSGP